MVWLRAHYQIGLYEDMKIIPDRMLGAASARSTPIRFWKLRRTALPPARARNGANASDSQRTGCFASSRTVAHRFELSIVNRYQPRLSHSSGPLIFDRTNQNQILADSTMPDETSEPQATEKKRALAVRDLKPKSDPKGGAAKGGKSDKITPRTEEVDFDWTLRS